MSAKTETLRLATPYKIRLLLVQVQHLLHEKRDQMWRPVVQFLEAWLVCHAEIRTACESFDWNALLSIEMLLTVPNSSKLNTSRFEKMGTMVIDGNRTWSFDGRKNGSAVVDEWWWWAGCRLWAVDGVAVSGCGWLVVGWWRWVVRRGRYWQLINRDFLLKKDIKNKQMHRPPASDSIKASNRNLFITIQELKSSQNRHDSSSHGWQGRDTLARKLVLTVGVTSRVDGRRHGTLTGLILQARRILRASSRSAHNLMTL